MRRCHGLLDVDRCGDGAQRVVGLRDGRAEVGHHRVADELVDGAAALEDAVRHQLEDLVEEGHHLVRLEPLREVREAADVGEQDGDLALDPAAPLLLRALEQLVQHIVVHVAAEGVLDALLLLERIAHLVEGSRQLAHLVAGGRRDAHREIAGRQLLDAVAQAPQRADQQRDEDHAGDDAQHDHRDGDGGELPGVAAHDRVDQHGEVELHLGLADPHAAVEDRGGEDQPPRHPAGAR